MAKKMTERPYNPPVVAAPNIKQLGDIATNAGIDMTEEELNEYKGVIDGMVASFQHLDSLPEPTLPVKYPRTPGYRPTKEENPYNAWYYKTDIPGSSDGPLKGKKIVVKDTIVLAGVPMMNGNKVMEGYVPEFDATVVTRVLEAGGHIIGKGVSEDFSFSGASCTSSKGRVINPLDHTRSAGGSSNGVAVLVQSGEADMAIGGDQGGSIRIPAAWTGIVGFKPTWGLVPYTGIASIEPSLDHTGPITRTVKDCALLLEVVSGYDAGRDPRQERFLQPCKYSQQLTKDLSGLKIGLLKEGFEGSQPEVDTIVRQAANSLTASGAIVSEVSLPLHNDGEAIWSPVINMGAYLGMFKHAHSMLGQKGYYATSMIDYMWQAIPARTSSFSPIIKLVHLYAEYLKQKYGFHWYAKCQNLSWMLTRKYDEILKQYDVIIMPTVKFLAPKVPSEDVCLKDLVEHTLGMAANTAPFDSTGHPALSINAGFTEGLPVGMMIVGNQFDDATVLKVAYAFEAIRDAKTSA